MVKYEKAFLEDVIANPEDDAPRLIFADWLEDLGDAARSEFIRVQCDRARLAPDHPRQPELARREQALLAEHARRWAGPLRGLVQEWEFRRGFVEAAGVADDEKGTRAAQRLAQLFRLAPIRDLHFELFWGMAPLLNAVGQVRRLKRLEIYAGTPVEAPALRNLFASPCAANLTTLLLTVDYIYQVPAEVWRSLERSRALGGLTELSICLGEWPGHFDKLALRAVARSRYLRGVRKLYLPHVSLTRELARMLVRSPNLAKLTHLSLAYSEGTEDGWRELLWSPALEGLERLVLNNIQIVRDNQRVPFRSDPLAEEALAHFGPAVLDYGALPEAAFPFWEGQTW
jgi:uncharacterized protein (TIGR02996 family)